MKSKRSSLPVPVEAAAKAVESKPEIAPDSSSIERIADSKPVDRYLAGIDALCDDAIRHDAVGILADVMAWQLAKIATSRSDPTVATADIARMFGEHVCDIAKQRKALAEAEKAKAEGVGIH